MFDAIAYFTAITNENKLARQSGFIPVTVSGPQNLEGLFEEYRDNDRFVAISDTSTGNIESRGGVDAFSKRRAYTVWILSAYDYDNMADRQRELELCRELFRQFCSRILHDKYEYSEQMMFIDTHSIPNQELSRYYLSGLTGLFFTIYVSEPVSLEYDDSEWAEPEPEPQPDPQPEPEPEPEPEP